MSEREIAVTAGSTTAEAQFFALRVEIDRSGADGGCGGRGEVCPASMVWCTRER